MISKRLEKQNYLKLQKLKKYNMANQRTILPELIRVSRNCAITNELYSILIQKLSDQEYETLHRWLQIVEDERNMEVSRKSKHIRGF